MKKVKNSFVIFSIGACGYGLIEIIWRGYTHWSMLGAGGISFLGLTGICKKFKAKRLLLKGVIGGAFITAVEYVFGIIFNIKLKKGIWDYSRMPLNLKGQICPLYSFFWVILSIIFIPLSEKICLRLERGNKNQ